MANMSLKRDGPIPTTISRNSDSDTIKKGTPASPAVALASKVLPLASERSEKKSWFYYLTKAKF